MCSLNIFAITNRITHLLLLPISHNLLMQFNPFVIRVLVGHAYVPVLITQVYSGQTVERYEAKGVEHPHIYLIVQTDGQYLKTINSRKKTAWKLYQGDTGDMGIFHAVCRGIKNKWTKVEKENAGEYIDPKNADLKKPKLHP